MALLATSNRLNHETTTGKFTCGYKKCGKPFTSAQGLAMHVGRVHTRTIPTAPRKKQKKTWSAERRARWEARTTAKGTPSKRKYAKRNKTQIVVNVAMPNFCPIDGIRMGKFCDECGMSAADLALALHTVKKMHAH